MRAAISISNCIITRPHRILGKSMPQSSRQTDGSRRCRQHSLPIIFGKQRCIRDLTRHLSGASNRLWTCIRSATCRLGKHMQRSALTHTALTRLINSRIDLLIEPAQNKWRKEGSGCRITEPVFSFPWMYDFAQPTRSRSHVDGGSLDNRITSTRPSHLCMRCIGHACVILTQKWHEYQPFSI